MAKVMLDAVPLHRHRIMQRLRLMVELPPGAVTGAVAGAVIGTVAEAVAEAVAAAVAEAVAKAVAGADDADAGSGSKAESSERGAAGLDV